MHKMPVAAVMAVIMKRVSMKKWSVHARKVWI